MDLAMLVAKSLPWLASKWNLVHARNSHDCILDFFTARAAVFSALAY